MGGPFLSRGPCPDQGDVRDPLLPPSVLVPVCLKPTSRCFWGLLPAAAVTADHRLSAGGSPAIASLTLRRQLWVPGVGPSGLRGESQPFPASKGSSTPGWGPYIPQISALVPCPLHWLWPSRLPLPLKWTLVWTGRVRVISHLKDLKSPFCHMRRHIHGLGGEAPDTWGQLGDKQYQGV